MGFFDKLFEKNENPIPKIPIVKDFQNNLDQIKEILKDGDDIIYREFMVGQEQDMKFGLVYAEGLADKNLLNEHILQNLMVLCRTAPMEVPDLRDKIYETIKNGSVAVTDLKEIDDIQVAIDMILSGESILLLNHWDKALVIATKGWPMRGVNAPDTEKVIRGPSDGFNETLRVNTALVRRRIRDPKFKIKQMQVGQRSKTDIAILYIEDIVNKDILKMVKERIDAIDIDAIMESGYIEQLIQDSWRSPFPQMQHTQRPDTVAAALYEGRVAVIVDNTPFVLIMPATVVTLIQSPEDYYERPFIATAIRMLRFAALILSLIMPSLYIAITSYHPGMLPTDLAMYVAGSRANVPFPAFIEAFIMEAALELLREAGIRLPGPIGSTIGIVGGLVLGQAAVEAGIVSPLMVIVVALTAIAGYSSPSYSLAISYRLLRFVMMAFAAFLGLYGVIWVIIAILIHLCNLKSFGVPYLSPFVGSAATPQDFKDVFIRAPLRFMKNRPQYLQQGDSQRLAYDKQEILTEEGDGNGKQK
jgi:spore germination protein